MPELRGESTWEPHAYFQKRTKRQATPNHKGVHLRQRNKKFAARLCVPGRKRQKLDLGEYNTHDAAARAYQVGAFYYNKPLDSTCEDLSFIDSLPSVPENLSDGEKLAWVRKRARQSVASINTPERNASRVGTLEARPAVDQHKQKSGSSHVPKEETTGIKRRKSGDTRLPNVEGQQGRDASPLSNLALEGRNSTSLSNLVSEGRDSTPLSNLASEGRNSTPLRNLASEGRNASPLSNLASEGRNTTPLSNLASEGRNATLLSNLAFGGRNATPLSNLAPVADLPPAPQFKMTDAILFASCELRKQGWEWTLKLRSPSSVEDGVIYSVPQSQYPTPSRVMTDIIVKSFYELREQGWEVHLEPRKIDNVEGVVEIPPTRSVPTLSFVNSSVCLNN